MIDTFQDEKFAALEAAELLGERLDAVRIDTPGSRRGNLVALLNEIRWELDLRGYEHVKLFVSGGLDEYTIAQLNEVADGYGVGTAISNAPVINLAMDIVEIEGEPLTKRGKCSGVKNVAVCGECSTRRLVREADPVKQCQCGGQPVLLLQPLMRSGDLDSELPAVGQIRTRCQEQVHNLLAAKPEAGDFSVSGGR